MDTERRTRGRAFCCLLAGTALSPALHADDLSVLGFAFVFWPAALVFIFILLLLSLFNARGLCRKKTGRAAMVRAAITLAWAAAGMIAFPEILSGSRFRQLATLTIVPVEIAGALATIIALWLLALGFLSKRKGGSQ
ncbi:MAG: hypothetical protein JXO51_06395 [Candidatus Aminicenantes bacterium]|nr:hypothetical protein [Candidatus Aminicenantes bacterium]